MFIIVEILKENNYDEIGLRKMFMNVLFTNQNFNYEH